jgi:hypothetical protein
LDTKASAMVSPDFLLTWFGSRMPPFFPVSQMPDRTSQHFPVENLGTLLGSDFTSSLGGKETSSLGRKETLHGLFGLLI